MPTHTYNSPRPALGDPSRVPRTAGGTVTAGNIATVIVDDAASKLEVLQALEAVKNKITTSTWPPTGS
jgi:hypothetical protein